VTGLDNLPSKMLKIAVSVLAPSLTFLFNQLISSGIVPTEWKWCQFSKGAKDKTFITYNQPIWIIPAVTKVFKRIIFNKFYKYANGNDLLANWQFSFRSLHSALTSLLEASSSWFVNTDNGPINGVIFIHVDLKEAFDTIDHKILFWKLASYGIEQGAL